MECRAGCGTCCIALSISSPIPGMPNGKPAGVRCLHLTPDNRCDLYGQPERPDVCRRLRPSEEMCGRTREDALAYLVFLERATAPSPSLPPPARGAVRASAPISVAPARMTSTGTIA